MFIIHCYMSNLFSKLNETYDEPAEKHPLRWWHIPLLILLICGTIYVMRTNQGRFGSDAVSTTWDKNTLQRSEGAIFGTFYHITYQCNHPLDEGIKATLDKVDNSLSPFNKNSTITAINNNTSLKADSMFIRVFNLSKQVASETDGAFDITVAPFVNLWGFGFNNIKNVTKESIDSIRQYVGINNVSLNGDEIIKQHPETMLDCSAIAKGYGVDAVGEYLESKGVQQYMVEIGGEVRVRGFNPNGVKWKIGITKPNDDSTNLKSDIEEIIMVTDISMATSGNYRNFYIKEGKKYAHTIDPRTGYPVQHNILSSTVLAADCATADAYATSFMVLGLEDAKKVLDKHNELMAFFIYTKPDGSTAEWYSPKLETLIAK